MMEGSLWEKIIYIIIGYAISLLMCFIVLNIVSDRKSIITRIGDRTFPIYLFHVFIVKFLRKTPLLHETATFILLPLLLVLTLSIVMLLENELFIKATYFLCNPLELITAIKASIYKRARKTDAYI